MRKKLKFWSLSGLALIGISLLLLVNFGARLEHYESGVHRRLLLSAGAVIAFPVYSGSGESVRVKGYMEGPVVRTDPSGQWHAKWFCEDAVQETRGQQATLQFSCAGRHWTLPLVAPPLIEEAPMPARLVVLSDLEGNLRFLEAALKKLAIVDEHSRWAFGEGHLVILGDSVDRGREVSAVLWTLFRLSVEAQTHGGAVHVVLGNHEQYLLRNNLSRAHPEQIHALAQLGGAEQSFSDETVLGHWLRTRPVALKLGRNLFVHGGGRPEVLQPDMSLAALNQASRDYLMKRDAVPAPLLEAVFGYKGVTQDRAWVQPLETETPAEQARQLEQWLAHFSSERMIVGHTQVSRITSLHNRKVWAVNVNSNEAAPEALMFTENEPQVVDIGVSRDLSANERLFLRGFNVWSESDRAILADLIAAMRELSARPHPY